MNGVLFLIPRKKAALIRPLNVQVNISRLEVHIITAPSSYDGEVMESTKSPFSDRLMLIHVTLLVSSSLGNYGMGMAASQRRDLATVYARLLVEGSAYGEDGTNLLIENGWMEQPPIAPDRNTLAKGK
ncbi:DUF3231 family protein [Effusibacillus consociatus]|uniref:DUF3231 family protein n=1 Tax=Effusibacillus consociatus TaxID=1117041 RepID=A0ABV9Q7X5_9BACL